MKVLLTAPSLDLEFGGPAAKLSGLRSALAGMGVDVSIAAPSRRGAPDGMRARLQFHGTPIPLRLGSVVSAARAVDVVHIIGYRDPVGTLAAASARMAGVPWLLEPAGMFHRRLRSLRLKRLFDQSIGRIVVDGARLVVATSRAEGDELIAGGIPDSRIVVRPNGLDLPAPGEQPPRGALRRRLGIPDDAPLVLSLARITSKKGLPELIRAVTATADLFLVIAGPDDRDGTLERIRAMAAAGPPRIHVVGHGLFGVEKRQALADADVFCLYSLSENFGTAAAEAAAAGVATVVSDRCGVAEWMSGGVEIVPYGHGGALAATLRRLATEPARRAHLAEGGRKAAESLQWPLVAAQQMALYHQALADR